jgi:uncharacterized UBP type Zn finger protein
VQILKNVDYPGVLEIPPHIMSEELQQRVLGCGDGVGQGQGCMYQLQAVVLHHGKRATGGHYSAYTRDSVGAPSQDRPAEPLWRSMNDSKVNVITEAQALAALDSVRNKHKYSHSQTHTYTA